MSKVVACLLGSLWLAWVGDCAAGQPEPAVWRGTVIYITDGDTLWIRPLHGGRARKIRLDGIDAPEICQAYGVRARERLAAFVRGRQVRVMTRGRDDYRREMARVELQGQDIGAWMVVRGLAWSYRFRRDPGPYVGLEALARKQRRGLFAQDKPLQPRDFRRRHGSCH